MQYHHECRISRHSSILNHPPILNLDLPSNPKSLISLQFSVLDLHPFLNHFSALDLHPFLNHFSVLDLPPFLNPTTHPPLTIQPHLSESRMPSPFSVLQDPNPTPL